MSTIPPTVGLTIGFILLWGSALFRLLQKSGARAPYRLRSWRSKWISKRCRRSSRCTGHIALFQECAVVFCEAHGTLRLITDVFEMQRARQLHNARQKRGL